MAAKGRRIGVAGVALMALFLIGCGPEDSHGPMQDLTPDQQRAAKIKAIQNNPDMPENAKRMAIGMISSNGKPATH